MQHITELHDGASSGWLWSSAVDLAHQGAGLLVGEDRGHLPIEIFSPLGRVLVADAGIIGFNEDPAFDRSWGMEALPGGAGRKGCTGGQELAGSFLVITGLELPVHQEGHGRLISRPLPCSLTVGCASARGHMDG